MMRIAGNRGCLIDPINMGSGGDTQWVYGAKPLSGATPPATATLNAKHFSQSSKADDTIYFLNLLFQNSSKRGWNTIIEWWCLTCRQTSQVNKSFGSDYFPKFEVVNVSGTNMLLRTVEFGVWIKIPNSTLQSAEVCLQLTPQHLFVDPFWSLMEITDHRICLNFSWMPQILSGCFGWRVVLKRE